MKLYGTGQIELPAVLTIVRAGAIRHVHTHGGRAFPRNCKRVYLNNFVGEVPIVTHADLSNVIEAGN